MSDRLYRLTRSTAGFRDGEVLEVTARYGDWHLYDVKLRSRSGSVLGSLELTADELDRVAEPLTTDHPDDSRPGSDHSREDSEGAFDSTDVESGRKTTDETDEWHPWESPSDNV